MREDQWNTMTCRQVACTRLGMSSFSRILYVCVNAKHLTRFEKGLRWQNGEFQRLYDIWACVASKKAHNILNK